MPAKMGRDDRERKTAHKPSTDLCRNETMLRRVEQLTGDTPPTRQENTQRAGFTRQSKRKAGRAAGPKTAPSDAPYAGIDHDMGTALDSEGHSNSAANICGSAHGTADSGQAETDGNGAPGVMSNPGAGGGTRAAIEAFATNYCPYNARGRDSGNTAASITGADAVGHVNDHIFIGAAENGAPHGKNRQ